VTFADTSALYAFLDGDDFHHRSAVEAEVGLREGREELWTIDPVLTELWWLLRRSLSRDLCDQLVFGLLERGLRREQLLQDDLQRAWQIGQLWPDQDFSFTDREAFAAIERSGSLTAWSYDSDFTVIRLGPRRSLSIALIS